MPPIQGKFRAMDRANAQRAKGIRSASKQRDGAPLVPEYHHLDVEVDGAAHGPTVLPVRAKSYQSWRRGCPPHVAGFFLRVDAAPFAACFQAAT